MNISSKTNTTIPITLANCSVLKPLKSFGDFLDFRSIAHNRLSLHFNTPPSQTKDHPRNHPRFTPPPPFDPASVARFASRPRCAPGRSHPPHTENPRPRRHAQTPP